MIYLIYLIGATLTTILCYLTNPIVVLFCNEHGELRGFWHYWQTWDDSVDSGWYMTEIIPNSKFLKIFDYNYRDHYIMSNGTNDYLASVGRTRYYSECIKPLTFTEKVKRYFCRVCWLMRNNAYGFSFYLLGRKVIGDDNLVREINGNEKFVYEKDGSWFTKTWMYKNDNHIIGKLSWNILLGWKINEDSKLPTQAMIANRVAFSWD